MQIHALMLVCISTCFFFSSADSPHLEQPEIFLLLQTVINILLPPRIISTSRTKNFMLDASPAHCSTPGDTGKDLRREGLAESTSQAAYLGMSETWYHGMTAFIPHSLLTLLSPSFVSSVCSSEGGAGLLWALVGKPVVPAKPAGEGDGSEEGGRPGLLGLHWLHCSNPHPYLCLAETFHTVQGKKKNIVSFSATLFRSICFGYVLDLTAPYMFMFI